ncbi:MAG: deoxyribonuclease IV [bacterium]|nr:deoxyribonuclease IV [bacterium]
MRFGVHMKTQGGLSATLDRAVGMGCQTMQIFTTNPMGWKGSVIPQKDAELFRCRVDEAGFGPVFTHSIYLLNFASENKELRQKSVNALAGEMERASQIGAAGVVTHLGSRAVAIEERAVIIAEAVDTALDMAGVSSTLLLLENSAGSGNTAGADFTELGLIIQASKMPDRLGVCLDTCHMWGAGYSIKTDEDAGNTFSAFEEAVGMSRLHLVHANDSKMELGSRKDRHEHIGEGYIGEDGFASMFRVKRLPEDLPLIIETPGDNAAKDCDNLRNLERIHLDFCTT